MYINNYACDHVMSMDIGTTREDNLMILNNGRSVVGRTK